jgi:hypothetical protein
VTATDPNVSADTDADAVVEQIQAAVSELGEIEGNDAVPLAELTERLAELHASLQGALTELDRA